MKSEYNLRDTINQFTKELCYYNHMHILAMSTDEKNYYLDLMNNKTETLINNLETLLNQPIPEAGTDANKIFTVEELSQFNGSNGKPPYVAVNGIVYDMSNITAWGGGTHFGLFAGKDLSESFNECHQGMEEVLDKLPKVGIMKQNM